MNALTFTGVAYQSAPLLTVEPANVIRSRLEVTAAPAFSDRPDAELNPFAKLMVGVELPVWMV